MKVSILDYGAGNVRSVRNAIMATGYTNIEDITSPQQIIDAECIVFPGVGSYQTAMNVLHDKQYIEPLKTYLQNKDRPFLGICLGMQTLFDSSEEIGASESSSGVKTTVPGLGIIPGKVIKFDASNDDCSVPHIGWNGRVQHQTSPVLENIPSDAETYFVHSYYAEIIPGNHDWILTSTKYGGSDFISSIQSKCVVATQFHPEKSGTIGLQIMKNFLVASEKNILQNTQPINGIELSTATTQLTKRIVVALDVRTNDDGELVVTKGDQYDVREKKTDTTNINEIEDEMTTSTTTNNKKGIVRNLGQPVDLASRYYNENIDEIAFLNITSFRNGVIDDMPMLHILENASKNIFVPLTVGGGIRSYKDPISNITYSALEVAARYFRAGADKVRLTKAYYYKKNIILCVLRCRVFIVIRKSHS